MMGPEREGAHCGEDVAAYALGALPAPDAYEFERHLRSCELCQTDLASLRPAVDALPLSVDAVEPPPQLRKRIMTVVEADVRERRAAEKAGRERRFSWRPLPALAAACAVLIVGVAVGTAVTGEGTGPEPARTVTAASTPEGATATVEVMQRGGRLHVEDMPKAPVGRVYQVWLRRGDEPPEPTDALFEVRRDGTADVAVPGDLEGVRQVLVTHEPRGGSTVPTQTPAIVADL